jgi:hypothetical protein
VTTTPTTASEVPESASTTASARTITYTWIILCAITILSWWLAPGWLKASTDAWLTVLWVAILGIYLF